MAAFAERVLDPRFDVAVMEVDQIAEFPGDAALPCTKCIARRVARCWTYEAGPELFDGPVRLWL